MKNLFKIDASAGSGKTYSLTRRFLELLADGDMQVNPHCEALPKNGVATQNGVMPKNNTSATERTHTGQAHPEAVSSYTTSKSAAHSDSNSISATNSANNNRRKFHYNFAEILAVTFTNLAATQMQERVISALKNIALGKNIADGKNTANKNIVDEKWTQEQANNALEQIFHRYSALNIKTIDSLLHHLVRISALELEISPQFEVTFDKTQIMSPIFDDIALKALHDEEYAKLFYNVCDSMIQYTPKFRKFLAGDALKNQCMDIAYDLVNSNLISTYSTNKTDSIPNSVPNSMPDSIPNVIEDNLDDVSEMLDGMGLSLEELENYAYGLNSMEYFDEKYGEQKKPIPFTQKAELEEVFATATDDAKKVAKDMQTILQEEELAANANFTKALAALADGINKNSSYFSKDNLNGCLNKSSKDMASDEALKRYEILKESTGVFSSIEPVIRKALQYLPMLELAKLVENKVWQTEKEKSLLLSSRMPFLVSKILRNDYYVSGAFCRMGARLTHILLDEFQDTSGDQWKALEPLAREALSLAGSVFFVGDVKQAIYGWRGGDAELFNSAPEGLKPYASGYEHKPLEYNWRSEAHIVEWNNAFFAGLTHVQNVENAVKFFLGKELDAKLATDFDLQETCHACAEKVANVYAFAKQKISPEKEGKEKQGLVQLHHINVPTKKIKVATLSLVASCVHKLHERHEWHDICVLTITNDQASLVAELLLSQSIPVVSQGSLLMAEHPIIIELTALMRFLSNPMDEQAFWHVLVSKYILPANLCEASLFDFLTDKRKESLFQSFRKKFDDIWQLYFKPLIDGAGLMTAYDTLCEIYKRWEVRERNPKAEIFLLRFLEIVHLAEENSLMDLDAFLLWWDTHAEMEKAPLPKNTGAVSVMTVHKAKGLEFDAVLIPWHDFKVYPDRESAQIINYKYKDKNLKIFSTIMKEHGLPYYEALFEKVIESINTLYVAWTRPVKELHVFLPKDEDKHFPKFLQYMIESFKKDDLGAACSHSIEEHADYTNYGMPADAAYTEKKSGIADAENKKNAAGYENMSASPLVEPVFLRMLEYWLCKNNESFVPVYENAKSFVTQKMQNTVSFDYLDDDFDDMKNSDTLYIARKISSLFSKISEQELRQKQTEQSHIKSQGQKNNEKIVRGNLLDIRGKTCETAHGDAYAQRHIEEHDNVVAEKMPAEKMPAGAILAPEYLQTIHAKKWERPMAWLPRIKVFRSNLQDIRNHAQISANKRGTLMHKCLESLVYSGDAINDVNRAIKDAMGFLPTSFQPVHGMAEFQDALIWFLGLENPLGGAKEWLRYGLKEHALSSADGKMYRVDLLVNRPNFIRRVKKGAGEGKDDGEEDIFELVAIDYKTGYHEELPNKENVEQIKNYLSLLHEATQNNTQDNTDNELAPKKVIGLLVYLDRKEVCIVRL